MKKYESFCRTTFIFRERYHSLSVSPAKNQIIKIQEQIICHKRFQKALCIFVLWTGGQPIHALADGSVQGDGREG